MSTSIKKEYSNGELTVVWEPGKCIHSEVCVKTLPNVYRPTEKPWIKIDEASTEDLKKQIDQCPSAALSYYMNAEGPKSESNAENIKVVVMDKGPLLVTGDLEVKGKDGSVEMKSKTTAFCRCGASSNKPYCDGSHNAIDFDS